MRASECPQVSGLWGREVRGGCFAFSETLWARKLRGPSIRLSDSYTTTPPVLFFNPEPLKAVVLINVIALSYSSSASLPPFQKWGEGLRRMMVEGEALCVFGKGHGEMDMR